MEAKKEVKNGEIFKFFFKHAWRYKLACICSFLVVTLAVSGDLMSPWFQKNLFDLLTKNSPSKELLGALAVALAWVFAARMIGWVGWRSWGFLQVWFQPKVMADLQQTGFENMIGHSHDFFSNAFSGSLVRRISRVGRAFEGVMDELFANLWPTALVIVAALFGLYSRFPSLAYIFAAFIVVFIVLNYLATMWKMKLDVLRSEMDSKVTGTISDAISNSSAVKQYSGELFEARLIRNVLNAWSDLYTRGWRRGEYVTAVQAFAMTVINIGIMWYSVNLWVSGRLSIGDLVLIQSYLGMVMDKLWNISRSFRKVYESLADAREMVEIINTEYEVKDAQDVKKLAVKAGAIEFQNVGFGFKEGRKILKDFSLAIKPGEKVALVGPSGAGKSTVTKLLFRLYDIQKGQIMIDGQDIAQVTQKSLRENIALVPQEPALFHRTLRDNIRYGRRNATDKEIIEAAKKAHCHEFISKLKDGYDTFVGERGIKLSGGERQRVAIARAILKDAPILVLDEATSSLDSESERLIQDALHELMKGKTSIVIAHRLSTVMEMDRIIVVENGEVKATGTHDELLGEKGMYRKLWNIQVGGYAGNG
ncbi:MAG: ABC transporter ATP-binding protein [bacterium]